ncbi:MAG: hypothetical protein WCI51_09260 [Lentisphaerota bacterium]
MFIKIHNIFGNYILTCLLNSLITGAVLFYCSGCATARPAPKLNASPEDMQKLPPAVSNKVKKLETQDERNSVINLTEVAIDSINHRYSMPKKLWPALIDEPLDLAIKRIEEVYSNTPEANKARSLWHEEETKDFKGEPYERVFVLMLRGLRYYENGDYDNAIACFKSSILQDSLATEGKFNADISLAEWMTGLCHMRLGEKSEADEAFKRAESIRPSLKLPKESHNTIIVFFAGAGPVKKRTGKYEEILLFEKGMCNTLNIKLSTPTLGSLPSFRNALMIEDLFFQAVTRGGRAIDLINQYKSTVKDDTKIVGNIAILLGLTAVGTALIVAASGNPVLIIPLGSAGLGLIALGIGAHVTATMIKTKADIRTISGVPDRIFIWSGNILPGKRMLGIRPLDMANQGSMIFHETFIQYGNKHNVVYVFSN